jgi:hypothetical protein
VALIRLLKGKRILDLGRGAGRDCYALAKIQIQHAIVERPTVKKNARLGAK